MRVIDKYLTRSILYPTLYSVMVLTSLIWLSRILKMLYLFQKNIGVVDFIFISILIIPFLVHSIMPFAVLYSSLYSFNNLRVNKELVIFEVNGITHKRFLFPVIRALSIIAFLGVINSSFIMPWCYSSLKDRIHVYKSSFVLSVVKPGMFNDITKNLVLYVDSKRSDKRFNGIILFDSRDKNNHVMFNAKNAELKIDNSDIYLNLYDGSRQSYGKTNSYEMLKFNSFKIKATPDKMGNRGNIHNLELIIWDLLFPPFNNPEKSTRYTAEGHNRLIWPLMSIVVPLIALSVYLRSPYNRKNYTYALVVAFLVGVFFILAHIFIISYARSDYAMNKYLYINFIVGLLLSYYLSSAKKLPKFLLN